MSNSYSKLPDLGVWHIVGINGIGMSGIARMLKAMGCKVQGSDLGVTAATKLLEADGIKVYVGHDAQNIIGANIVVRSTAVKDHNPEIIAARSSDITVLSRAQILQMMLRDKRNILVTGAHGKTTTTAMTAHILIKSNIDLNVLLGGNSISLNGSNYRSGSSSDCVVEADESDGTFIKLSMDIGIITNIDIEHMDYYKTFDNLLENYRQFMRNVPIDGLLIINADDSHIKDCLNKEKDIIAKVMTFSINGNEADFKVTNHTIESEMQKFELAFSNKACQYFGLSCNTHTFSLKVFGTHNVANATAAIIAALAKGISIKEIESALSSFTSVNRRFTHIGQIKGATLVDDYAHHPAAVKVTLDTASNLLSVAKTKGKIIAVLQPHRYSRLKNLFDDYVTCCASADIILVLDVYAAGEEAIKDIDSNALTNALLAKGHEATYVGSQAQLADKLVGIISSGDYVIFLGAGDISKRAYEIFETFSSTPL